jgi:hypothetical protein
MNKKLILKAALTGIVAIAGIVVQALPDGTSKGDEKPEKADDKA